MILKEIIENSDNITGKELESKFHLSRKQLSYGIGKINDYLRDCGYPEITRASNGRVNISAQVISGVNLEELEKENEEIVFSKEERIDILQLMLLGSREELSLQHFISELKVSKNTVLADLKKLDKSLSQNRLKLSYGRQKGYTLTGSEYDKRQLLIVTLSNMIIQYGHVHIVREICGITQNEVGEVRHMLEGIEEELELRLAGEMLEANSYLFALIFRRIREGMVLEEVPESIRTIDETLEYDVSRKYAARLNIDNVDEIMYLTAHIQGMKIESAGRVWDVVNEFQLRKAVKETIANYERLAGIRISEREELETLLLHHCGPALYRIRYDFHMGLDITELVLPEYQDIHELVREACAPLEEAVYSESYLHRIYGKKSEFPEIVKRKKIPEKELVYITLIIASFTLKERLKVEDRCPKAVVVCQNGITVSRVLMTLLHNLFPEIKFTTCMSAGQLEKYQEAYDLVFSTISLNAEKPVYIVDPLMNEKQQRNLREKVLKEIPISGKRVGESQELLKMALKYTSDTGYPLGHRRASTAEDYQLKDLLTVENIRITKADLDWRSAIELAAMPLMYEHSIQIGYVEAIINSILIEQPYLAVADGVIIAHAGIDAGVNDVGMSMLVLPKKISVHNYLDAKVIIVLATPDYEKHLTALNELILVLDDKEKLKKMKNAEVPEDILELI